MHTTRLKDGWFAIHNGDYSGDVIIRHQDSTFTLATFDTEITIPFSVLEEIVANKVRDEFINRVENAEPSEILLGMLIIQEHDNAR